MKPFTLISVLFLTMLAAAHLVRSLLGLEVRVGALVVPVWASLVACLFIAALTGLLVWEQRKT